MEIISGDRGGEIEGKGRMLQPRNLKFEREVNYIVNEHDIMYNISSIAAATD